MDTFLINTSRLQIRNMQVNDLDDFLVYRSNPEVTKYQGFDVMNREQAAEFISGQVGKGFGKPGEWVQYAIVHTGSGKLIGDCAIHLKGDDERIGEIGITISHIEQGRGYAKEVMSAILEFLFKQKGLHRVEETVDVENNASIRLLESVGFRREGHFIENIFFKGAWGSEYRYAILAREFTSRSIPKNIN